MRILTYFILVFFLVFSCNLFSQTQISITTPQLEHVDNELIIEYEILNSQSKDIFIVWLEITDASGNTIKAGAFSGDIGEEIKGGRNKKIVWNLDEDEILVDEEIFVQVVAENVTPPEPEKKTEAEKIPETDQEEKPAETTSPAVVKHYSKGNVIFSSVFIPGWGQSKIKKGKPFWLLGVAGYGCLAGSFAMNRTAIKTYDDYEVSMDKNESNSLYDKSLKQDNISEYMAYTAAGIWAINIIWAIAIPVTSKESTDLKRFDNIDIQPTYNHQMNCTMVSLTYKF